jgi:hypothetical protein
MRRRKQEINREINTLNGNRKNAEKIGKKKKEGETAESRNRKSTTSLNPQSLMVYKQTVTS